MEKQRRKVDIDGIKGKKRNDNSKIAFYHVEGRVYHRDKMKARSKWTSNYNTYKLIAGVIVLIAIAVFLITI